MSKHSDQIRNQLSSENNATIEAIQFQLRPVRNKTEKLRTLFTETLLTDEWIHTTDIMVIAGLRKGAVHRSLVDLRSEETIEGKAISQLNYYESLRNRHDNAAKLLIALASIRNGCEPEDLPLTLLTIPDSERTDADGNTMSVQFSAFYWKKTDHLGGGSETDIVELPIDSGERAPVLV